MFRSSNQPRVSLRRKHRTKALLELGEDRSNLGRTLPLWPEPSLLPVPTLVSKQIDAHGEITGVVPTATLPRYARARDTAVL